MISPAISFYNIYIVLSKDLYASGFAFAGIPEVITTISEPSASL